MLHPVIYKTCFYLPVSEPHRLLVTTLLGLAAGYQVSKFEDNYEDYILKAQKERPLAPIHPRKSLLTYQAMVRRKQEEQSEGSKFM